MMSRRRFVTFCLLCMASLTGGCGKVPTLRGPARTHAFHEVVDSRLEGDRLTLLVIRVVQTTRDEFMAHSAVVLATRTRHYVLEYDMVTDGDNLRAELRGCEELEGADDPRGGKLVLAGQPPQALRLPYPDGAELYEPATHTWRVVSPPQRTVAQVAGPIFNRERTWVFNGGLLNFAADLKSAAYVPAAFGEAFNRLKASGGPGHVSGDGEEVLLGPETVNTGFASIYDRQGHRRDLPLDRSLSLGAAAAARVNGHWLVLGGFGETTTVANPDAGTNRQCPHGDFLTWNPDQGHVVFLKRGDFTRPPAPPTTEEIALWDFHADRLVRGRLTWPDYPR